MSLKARILFLHPISITPFPPAQETLGKTFLVRIDSIDILISKAADWRSPSSPAATSLGVNRSLASPQMRPPSLYQCLLILEDGQFHSVDRKRRVSVSCPVQQVLSKCPHRMHVQDGIRQISQGFKSLSSLPILVIYLLCNIGGVIQISLTSAFSSRKWRVHSILFTFCQVYTIHNVKHLPQACHIESTQYMLNVNFYLPLFFPLLCFFSLHIKSNVYFYNSTSPGSLKVLFFVDSFSVR